jgi:transposase-like protein
MKRRRIDPETKMAAVLEGLRGESSMADICHKYQISESLYYRWRDKFLEGGRQAEAKIREGLKNPPPVVETPTDMALLELVNLRLDYVQACKCSTYYLEYVYLARRLVRIWTGINCSDITTRMVQDFLIQRGKDSAFAANKDLRYLRATFNFGIKQGLIKTNPSHGLEFMPVDRKLKYFPPKRMWPRCCWRRTRMSRIPWWP